MTSACRLRVNGVERQISVDGADTLLPVLRDQLGLLGAKCGCNEGVCGACTVLLDHRSVRACLSLAANCTDREVMTVEGLQADSIGQKLQCAFEVAGAVQCGFCTPGMLMSAFALLIENRTPSIDEIRAGLSGNVCRCSGYRKIIDAVRRAAEDLAA